MPSSPRDKPISFRQVAYSQAVTERTIERWSTIGRKGVRLEWFSIGRQKLTTLSALTRFLAESFGTGSTGFTQLEFDFDAAERPAAARSLAIEVAESSPAGAELRNVVRSRCGRCATSSLSAEVREVSTDDVGLRQQDVAHLVVGECHA